MRWERWWFVIGGGAQVLLASINLLPSHLDAARVIQEVIDPLGQWGLFAFGLFFIAIGLLPFPIRLAIKVIPSEQVSRQGTLTVINAGEALVFFARAEAIAGFDESLARPFPQGHYHLKWLENGEREITIPRGGSARLVLAISQEHKTNRANRMVRLALQQAGPIEEWCTLIWRRPLDSSLANPVMALLRVTIGTSTAPKFYTFKPYEALFVVQGETVPGLLSALRTGGCFVRKATALESKSSRLEPPILDDPEDTGIDDDRVIPPPTTD